MMNSLRYLRQLLSSWLTLEKRRPLRRGRARSRLRFEELEDRLVPISTTTALSGTLLGGGALPSSIIYGTPIIFTATVTPSGGTTNPTGTVDFVDVSDNNFDLGSVAGTPGAGNSETFILPATGVNTLRVLQAGGGMHTITAVYTADSGFSGSTGTLAGGLTITPAPLTITATANTKIYESTTSASALPKVTGLKGNDTVTGMAEAYANANAGIGKTLNVSAYAVNDGNNGGNYSVTLVKSATGVINKATLTLTATTNTKTYDSTTMAAAIPTVSGLVGGDTVMGLLEVYDSANTGSGKTLSVDTSQSLSANLTGLGGPYALAFDTSGNLYVVNYVSNTVSKFAPGATTPSATLTGLNYPSALAFDGTGNLFVANYGGTTVSKFAPGATTPSATLTGLNYPTALAFDGSGNLYVLSRGNTALANGTVSIFSPGATTPSATLTGLNYPFGMAFDGSGDLFVANYGGTTVSKFAPGATTPSATLTGLNGPNAVAFDGSGNLYVANYASNTVSKFAPGGTTPGATLTGLNGPIAVAFDGSGNLYVANYGSGSGTTVTKFAPGGTTPSATLTLTGYGGPVALAFDDSGNLYVANYLDQTVNKFVPGLQINDGNGGNNYNVTKVANRTGAINKAFLTITATTNTKTYDGTSSSAATPTVSGLVAGDSMTGLAEVYSDKNAASGKTLSVSAYTVSDGNGGNNYSVTRVSNTAGVINKAPLTIGPRANTKIYDSTTSAAATPILSGLKGSDTVTGMAEAYNIANAGTGKMLSVSAYTIYDGNSGNNYTVTTLINPTGVINKASLAITATTNTKTYDGTTTAAALPTVSGLVGGDTVTGLEEVYSDANVGSSKTLSTSLYTVNDGVGGNNYTVTTVVNTTGVISVPRGLVVTSFTPTATGFTASFSKAFNPTDLTLYGANPGTEQDVTLVGAHVGPIHGSLLIDPSNMLVTFKATSSYVLELNSVAQSATVSPVLPDDFYTVKLVSGSGSNGFIDGLGTHLDGANNAGHANYTTTFTTSYQANATPVLGIPDFARGPDSNTPTLVPNNGAAGIPITLYNAAHVTDVTFSLTYNPALLNITGTLSGTASDATDAAATLSLLGNAGGVATFHYADNNPQSATTSKPLVLGDIMAVVPSNVGAAALGLYQAKELLQLGSIVINQGTITGATSANGVHVNAYFGDVNGDKVIDGLDKLGADNIAQGRGTGFNAYAQLDPVIIGDVASDLSIDAGDVSALDSYVVKLQPLQIPPTPTQLPATDPNYVNPGSIHAPDAADPTLSVVTRGLTAPGSPLVSIIIDHPHPDGSTGLTSASLALTFDPTILSISPSDITMGSIPMQGTGWQLIAQVDQATGQIGIELYSSTPIAANEAGSLVNIAFHILPNATIPSTPVQLLNMVTPDGQWFGTGVADSQGAMILSPGVDLLLLPTGVDMKRRP